MHKRLILGIAVLFLAVSIGAPLLFSLSTVLVEVLHTLLSGLPEVPQGNLAFTLSEIKISPDFILYFSIVFMIFSGILASLILGLVGKGEEKEGLKFLIPIIVISLSIFFLARILLMGYLKNILS